MIRVFKELGRAFFAGVVIFIVLGLIQFFVGNFDLTGSELLTAFFYNQIYTIVLYMVNAALITYLVRRYRTDIFKQKNLIKAILGGMLVTLIGLFFVRIITEVIIEGKAFFQFISEEQYDYYYVGFIISMIMISLFYAIYYYRHRQESKVKEQKFIARSASAQFDALKNQLDPHFLFNSLNVLTSLIEENPEAATRFTTSLSKVYRYVLEQKNKDLITVEEELKFAKLYMSLIDMRFEDSIVFTVPDTISNPEAKVVPLSLQLLLENAVKHNQVTPGRKLHIEIFERDGCLIIKNNVQPKNVVKESSGVGLQNIRQRYSLLTDRSVTISKSPTEFEVAIPMLTRATMTLKNQDTYISGKRYERAKKKVEELKGFYVHFSIYLFMVPVFIWLNIISSGFPWAIFPIGGWGLGVFGHAAEVFNWNPFFGKRWEEEQIRKYMNED